MSAEPIRYFHRAKKTVETEQVYGEGWLRWTYGNPVGRLTCEAVVKRVLLSRLYGWRMNRRYSAQQILPFIAKYDLDVDEFAKSPFAFKTFNDFFFRALKPGARPIAGLAPASTSTLLAGSTGSPQAASVQDRDPLAVLPADGRHLAVPDIGAAQGFYAKGQKFSLAGLVGEEGLPAAGQALTREFSGGSLLISRLCPVDYHRFHFPVGGLAGEPRPINGWLYSVSPIALRRNLAYLWENKRVVTLVESPVFGRVALVEIGATMVGSILQTFTAGRTVRKGDEKGLFRFGGSCVVTIFQRGRIRFDSDLVEPASRQMEVYARMGERLGEAV